MAAYRDSACPAGMVPPPARWLCQLASFEEFVGGYVFDAEDGGTVEDAVESGRALGGPSGVSRERDALLV